MDLVTITSSLVCLIGSALLASGISLNFKAHEKKSLSLTCILTISLSGLSVLLTFLALCIRKWKLILQVCHLTCSFSVGTNVWSLVTTHMYEGHLYSHYLVIAGAVLHFICAFTVVIFLHWYFRKHIAASKFESYSSLSGENSQSYETLVQERQSSLSGSNIYESVSLQLPQRQTLYGSTVGFQSLEEERIYINYSVQ